MESTPVNYPVNAAKRFSTPFNFSRPRAEIIRPGYN
jgi:hypothetical protein